VACRTLPHCILRAPAPQLDGALADFSHVIERRPRGALALFNRANVHCRMHNDAAALADLDAALRADPGDPDAYQNRRVVSGSVFYFVAPRLACSRGCHSCAN
jgi:hypothetical protein